MSSVGEPPAGPVAFSAQEVTAAIGGGFLRNTLRIPGRTCEVCTTPVEQRYALCYPCLQHRRAHQENPANLVVPLVYGIAGAQSGWLMHSYKGSAPGPADSARLKLLLAQAITLHGRCIERAVGHPFMTWTTVPSTRGRSGEHPIRDIAAFAAPAGLEIVLRPGPEFDTPQRQLAPNRWQVDNPRLVAGGHILIIDDTWTTGAKIQGAAIALRAAGAAATTALVLARWLDPHFADNKEFIRTHLTADYDTSLCPVTGGECPAR